MGFGLRLALAAAFALLQLAACSDDPGSAPDGAAGMAGGGVGTGASGGDAPRAGGGGASGSSAGGTGGTAGRAPEDLDAGMSSPRDAGDAAVDTDADAQAGEDAGCSGMAPRCFAECGGDRLLDDPARCAGDRWRCDQGVLPEDCPSSSCFGVPAFAETCVNGEWECHPDDETFQSCPTLACGTCRAFEGPVEQQGCRCECAADDTVLCDR